MTPASLVDLLSFGPDGWGDELAHGVCLTVSLALVTIPIGLAGGMVLALGRQSGGRTARAVCEILVTIFRGLPELLTIFIIYFGIGMALRWFGDRVGLPQLELDPFVAGVVALACIFSAFSSDVFLVAMRAVPDEQTASARALGLGPLQTFGLVLFPQVLRHALPGLSNLWLALLRDTSLVSLIALTELTRASIVAAAATREPLLFYGVACILYLGLSLLSALGLAWLRRRSERGLRMEHH